jgi:hypothetical protein
MIGEFVRLPQPALSGGTAFNRDTYTLCVGTRCLELPRATFPLRGVHG